MNLGIDKTADPSLSLHHLLDPEVLAGHFQARHDRAELALFEGLGGLGWRDGFRSVHGFGRRDRSWKPAFRHPGYRLDHVLASPAVDVLACDYVHAWREQGLSDHSAIVARLAVRPAGRGSTANQ